MKYLEEFRDPEVARRLLGRIRQTATRPWSLMEVCGGQTHAIMKYGLQELLPQEINLLHGPGCPVCVTPLEPGAIVGARSIPTGQQKYG